MNRKAPAGCKPQRDPERDFRKAADTERSPARVEATRPSFDATDEIEVTSKGGKDRDATVNAAAHETAAAKFAP